MQNCNNNNKLFIIQHLYNSKKNSKSFTKKDLIAKIEIVEIKLIQI